MLVALLLAVLVGGCTAAHYRAQADKDVYGILAAKQQKVFGTSAPFTVEPGTDDALKDLPRLFQPLLAPEDISGAEPSDLALAATGNDAQHPQAVLSLAAAVETAIQNSRDYQSRKEELFLAALELTAERHNWSPVFTGMLSGKWEKIAGEEAWAGNTEFGVSQMLATGGKITLGLSTDFLRFITGDPRPHAASVLSADFVQPLWRGAGRRVAQENLTQAERNVIYAVRAYARYHRTFAVDIAAKYYQVLQQRAFIRNEWSNFRRLEQARGRAESLARAGRLPEFELDQTRQDELAARIRYIQAVQGYGTLLDNFKISLGLGVEANVDVDAGEMQKLATAGLLKPDLPLDRAVAQALELRLDLQNADDGVADAERKVKVAADGTGPDVNLVGSAAVPSSVLHNTPGDLRFEKGSYSAGLDLDLPFDRTAERNAYRRSLIELERVRRNASLLRDTVRLQVRQEWRKLDELAATYDIALQSLDLARRRVTGTSLLQEAGRATARDVLDAQASLLAAQNGVTRALVDHTMARLDLWRDVETLLVAPDGTLTDQPPAK